VGYGLGLANRVSTLSTGALLPNRETSPLVRLWDGPPLQGDDYPLEYYEDGYPKLPACLHRGAAKD
ncbi:MAG: hypothetical protein WBW37_14545, partial [Methyloceanibacter sp.]